MASLSIMIFVLAITGGLFLIPFLVNKFSKNELLNIILQHSFILLGLLFLTLDTTIALTISNVYGVGVDSEMRMFLWIISKTAYLGMFIAVIHFIFKSIKIMQIRATNKRMGYD